MKNIAQPRLPSPTSSIRSVSSTHSLRIKLPRYFKLGSFFTPNPSQLDKNQFQVQGKTKNIINSSKLYKSVSGKSIYGCSLAKKMRESRFTENASRVQKQDTASIIKDQSRTRSRLTIYDDYGIESKKQKKVTILSPKVPKQLKSVSGNKKIIFPIKNIQKHPQSKSKDKKFTNNLQYTFGVQGFSFPRNPRK